MLFDEEDVTYQRPNGIMRHTGFCRQLNKASPPLIKDKHLGNLPGRGVGCSAFLTFFFALSINTVITSHGLPW